MSDASEHRTCLLTVRLRPAELAALRERARECGLPPSRYVREVALGAVPRPRALAANQQALYHLARIGNNLNQLAKLNNSNLPVPRSEVLEVLAVVRAAAARL